MDLQKTIERAKNILLKPREEWPVIEAESVEEAVRLVAGTPCAVADGVVEVWPLQREP